MQPICNAKSVVTFFACLSLLSACGSQSTPIKNESKPLIRNPTIGISIGLLPDIDSIRGVHYKTGLKILRLTHRSPAYKAGLRVGDIIVAYDNHLISNTSENLFKEYVASNHSGHPIKIKFLRFTKIIQGSINNTDIEIQDVDDVIIQLNTLPPGDSLSLSSNHLFTTEITQVQPEEKSRSKISSINDEYLASFHVKNNEYSTRILDLVNQYKIDDAYNDLIERYNHNELSNDPQRLSIFHHLHKNPLTLLDTANDMSYQIKHLAIKNELDSIILIASTWTDELMTIPSSLPKPPLTGDFPDHIQYIKTILSSAMTQWDQAFIALSHVDRKYIQTHLASLLTQFSSSYYIDQANNAEDIEYFLDIITLSESVRFENLYASAYLLSQLSDKEWLTAFHTAAKHYKSSANIEMPGIAGNILYYEDLATGPLVITGPGRNKYSKDFAYIFDLGGDDIYKTDHTSSRKDYPLRLLVDFAGNDHYSSASPYAQGGGTFGVSILSDQQGNDHYLGVDASQGVGVFGIGILQDNEGDDQYTGHTYNQGFGLWGTGLLLDRGGNDRYSSNQYAQGVGAPKGLGLLIDTKGDDNYYASGEFPSSYNTPGVFKGSAQGFGIGFRGYSSGGMGLLIDIEGKDNFHAGNFSQGGGYYFGLGILNNFGTGNDTYYGSRYSQGISAHSAIGVLIDEAGDDKYQGIHGALQAAAWDLGIAVLADYAGNDIYDSEFSFFSYCAASHNGFSLFIDNGGEDQYFYDSNSEPTLKNNYHGGHSLSFCFDNGGSMDVYNQSTDKNNQTFFDGTYHLSDDLESDIQSRDRPASGG